MDFYNQSINTPLRAPSPTNAHCTNTPLAELREPPGPVGTGREGRKFPKLVGSGKVGKLNVGKSNVLSSDVELLDSVGDGNVVESSSNENGAVCEGSTLTRDARPVCASGGGSKCRVLLRATKYDLAWLSSVAVVVNVVVR